MEWFFEDIPTLMMLCLLIASIVSFYYFERRFYTAPKGKVRVCHLDGDTLHIAGDFPSVLAAATHVSLAQYHGHVIVYDDGGQLL